MIFLLVSIAIGILFGGSSVQAQEVVPWWKQEKIRFMWGQWNHASADKSVDLWERDLPRSLFGNIAAAGATVFAELRGYKREHAHFAREFGMRYFATLFVTDLGKLEGRRWVDENGEHHWACPLDQSVYEKWIFQPHLSTERVSEWFLQDLAEGLIDGLHFDWEAYGGWGEAGTCYCDVCFSNFPSFQESGQELPEKLKRFAWLQQHDFVNAYEKNFSPRRIEMFTHIRLKLQARKPQLLFSSYDLFRSHFRQAMHTSHSPFIVFDTRNYANDDRQPWWESHGRRYEAEGYLYLPHGWTNALFGAQASQVSAARWIYEASINHGGCSLWFERELDDEILRAFATADRKIKAVQLKVGKYLFNGERDSNFVTAVEWTGRPQLERAVIQMTYHLDDQHLVHVNHVDTEWPLRVRIRFPRLSRQDRWTLRDAMNEVYYTHDGESAVWTSAELLAGVVVAMEPRSDLFLLVAPSDQHLDVDSRSLVRSRQFNALPDHEAAPHQAAVGNTLKLTENNGGKSKPSGRLVYTAIESMGFEGPEGSMTIGNAIRILDVGGQTQLRVRQLRGHLWSPQYSPDGKRIAFVHDAGGRGQIVVMAEDGLDATNMSRNDYCDRSPVWSPDGRKIAFMSDRTGDWDIYCMNADGSNQRRLAGNPGLDRAPAWSPDGGRLAWESHFSGMPNIWVCDAGGLNSRPLIAPDKPLSFVEMREGERNKTSKLVQVRPFFPDNTFHLEDPVWSPDGERIAAAGPSGAHTREFYHVAIIRADGSRLLRTGNGLRSVSDLCWSPDGTRLAGSCRTTPVETERSGIFVIRADGTDGPLGHLLVNVSPQGPRLGGALRHGLLTWYSHGSAQPRRVVKSFANLAWSPDGKILAFASDMDPTGAFYIYRISPEGGKPDRLEQTRSAWPQQIMWRPD